jgi:hypothetical protein
MLLDLSSVSTPTQNEPIKPGKHLVVISEAKLEPLYSGNGQKISVTFKIVHGDFKNRHIYHNFIIKHTNPTTEQIGQSQLKGFMMAAKMNLTLNSVTDLLAKIAWGHFKLETGTDGKERLKAVYFEEAKELEVKTPEDELGF